MVRVGREEAMHPEAANISSQQLAQRDLARIHSEQPTAPAGLNEEVPKGYYCAHIKYDREAHFVH